MKPLLIDTEQEAILRQTITGVSAFLLARCERRDPIGIISKAYQLQDRKCANMLFQLDQPPLAMWEDLPKHAQDDFDKLLHAWTAERSEHYRSILYRQILAFMNAHRAQPASQLDPVNGSKRKKLK